jgi:hypothetical protein
VVLIGSLWLWAGALVLFALPATPALLGVEVAAMALTGPAFDVVASSYRYALTPDHLQARAQSVGRIVAWGTIPIGTLLGGVLTQAIGPVPTLLLLSAALAAVADPATALGAIRDPPHLPR